MDAGIGRTVPLPSTGDYPNKARPGAMSIIKGLQTTGKARVVDRMMGSGILLYRRRDRGSADVCDGELPSMKTFPAAKVEDMIEMRTSVPFRRRVVTTSDDNGCVSVVPLKTLTSNDVSI
jgi:hypothetical protein